MYEPAMLLKLMFEWGGGCIWCRDDDTRALLGVGPVEDRLLLSPTTRGRLDELSARHDTKLNWSDPAGRTLWSVAEEASFDAEVTTLLQQIRSDLGPNLRIEYEPL
jgi:hypothetical protein